MPRLMQEKERAPEFVKFIVEAYSNRTTLDSTHEAERDNEADAMELAKAWASKGFWCCVFGVRPNGYSGPTIKVNPPTPR